MSSNPPRERWQSSTKDGLWSEVYQQFQMRIQGMVGDYPLPDDLDLAKDWLWGLVKLARYAIDKGTTSQLNILGFWYWGLIGENGSELSPGLLHQDVIRMSGLIEETLQNSSKLIIKTYVRLLHAVAMCESVLRDGVGFIEYLARMASSDYRHPWEIISRVAKNKDVYHITKRGIPKDRKEDRVLTETLRRVTFSARKQLKEIPLTSRTFSQYHRRMVDDMLRSILSSAPGDEPGFSLIRDQMAHGKFWLTGDDGLALDFHPHLIVHASRPPKDRRSEPEYEVRTVTAENAERTIQIISAMAVALYGVAEEVRYHWAVDSTTKQLTPPKQHVQAAKKELEFLKR